MVSLQTNIFFQLLQLENITIKVVLQTNPTLVISINVSIPTFPIILFQKSRFCLYRMYYNTNLLVLSHKRSIYGMRINTHKSLNNDMVGQVGALMGLVA